MILAFAEIPVLIAQAGGQESGSGLASMMMLLLPVMLLFYFMMLRPQQLQERKRKEMVDALKKNDRVVTAAGIYGTVASVDSDADKIVLRVDDDRGVKITFSKSSILRVLDATSDKEKTAEPAQRS
jgi:preprotein translocase subunit YajC